MRACSRRNSGEAACGHHGSLARPMPCSPVIAPPQAMIWRKSSSSARSARSFTPRLGHVGHDVDVDIAVARVTERGDLDPVFLLQPRGEIEQIDQPAARHADVLVELGQAGRLQRGGEFAAQIPEPFAGGFGRRRGDFQRAAGLEQLGEDADLRADGSRLAVDLDQEMRIAARDMFRAEMTSRGLEREAIGQLERGGEKAFAKDMLHAGRGDWRHSQTMRPGRPARAARESGAA